MRCSTRSVRVEDHTRASQDLSEQVRVPVGHLTELLATLQAQPAGAHQRFLRRFVEAWLIQQRETYDAEQHGGNDSEGAGW